MLLCNFQDDSDKCLDVNLQTFLTNFWSTWWWNSTWWNCCGLNLYVNIKISFVFQKGAKSLQKKPKNIFEKRESYSPATCNLWRGYYFTFAICYFFFFFLGSKIVSWRENFLMCLHLDKISVRRFKLVVRFASNINIASVIQVSQYFAPGK